MAALNEEQRRMATLLRLEFERDGIHLPPARRERLVALAAAVSAASMCR